MNNNPFEWLSQYDGLEEEKMFRDDDYVGFSDYYTEYSNEYDLGLWSEYLMKLSPIEIGERSKVLDLGCGAGYLMLDFMDAGSFVVGVDISAEMLMSADEVIRDCYEDDDYIPAILIQKDIAEFCLSVKFDLIYCMGDTLNYLSREKMEKTFNNVKKMLKEGSAFIVDVINPEHFMTDVPEEETITLHDKTKITFLRCLKLYDGQTCLDTEVIIKSQSGEVVDTEQHHQIVYSYDDMKEMAEKCGLKSERVPFLGDDTLTEKLQIVFTVK